MKEKTSFKHLATLLFLVFITIPNITLKSVSQEFSEEMLTSAMKELQQAHLNSISKEIDGVSVYFESNAPYSFSINQVENIKFKISSDYNIEHLDWNIELLIYKNKKLLSSHSMPELNNSKVSSLKSFKKYMRNFESGVSFEEVGIYEIVVESKTVDVEGNHISHKTYSNIIAQTPPSISLTGEIIESLLDTNDNGLADKLRVVLPFEGSIKPDEKYVISVELGNAEINGIGYIDTIEHALINNKKHPITSSEKNTISYGKDFIDSSDTSVEVEFDGKDIAEKHQSGKLRIVNIHISSFDLTRWKSIKKIPFLGETQSYSYTQFERQLITVHQDKADVSLVDQDLNGVYEGLNIKFDVSVVLNGRYEARMLYGEQPHPLFVIKEYFELSAGKQEINIFVPAQILVNTKAKGNTVLAAFHFRNTDGKDWMTGLRDNFGVTPNFTCKDFGDCTVRWPKPKTQRRLGDYN